MTRLLLYLPVIHAGYETFLARHAEADPDIEVLLLGRSFAADFPVVRKEIRALDPERAGAYLRAAGPLRRARVVEVDTLIAAIDAALSPGLAPGPAPGRSPGRDRRLVVPDEALLRDVVAAFALEEHADVEWEPTFLSWDREWSRAGLPPGYDGRITHEEYARRMQHLAATQAHLSSDWWRRVGAIAVRDDAVLGIDHNRHLPTEYAPYIDGDPRNSFRRGVAMEATTAIHAEAAVIARAARDGVSLAGADLHVSTFPCPGCARLIAEAGIARCYFAGGYSVLAGAEVMQAAGVELWFVSPEPITNEPVTPQPGPGADPRGPS